MPPRPLTNFEIQKYYQNESRFNGVYSRDNLPKINDGAYVINLDEYSNIGTHWVVFHVNNNDFTYYDSFQVDIFRKKLKNLLIVLCPLLPKIRTLKQTLSEYKHRIQ